MYVRIYAVAYKYEKPDPRIPFQIHTYVAVLKVSSELRYQLLEEEAKQKVK